MVQRLQQVEPFVFRGSVQFLLVQVASSAFRGAKGAVHLEDAFLYGGWNVHGRVVVWVSTPKAVGPFVDVVGSKSVGHAFYFVIHRVVRVGFHGGVFLRSVRFNGGGRFAAPQMKDDVLNEGGLWCSLRDFIRDGSSFWAPPSLFRRFGHEGKRLWDEKNMCGE